MRQAARLDDNHQEIVKALERVGAAVLSIAQLKNAFDILVGYRGKLFIMEIKDGNKPPSQRKLTAGELKTADKFEAVGVTYYVVLSVKEALKIIGAL